MFNYRAGRRSDLLLRPTPLLATGQGKVHIKYDDNAQISVKVKHLPAPTTLGPYTAYVLWALTPDGRAANLGVLAGADGGRGSIDTQHSASQFALIVTAEPHFAVSVPSTMIAMYNVAEDVKGNASTVASLTERADYSALKPIAISGTRPVEAVQAEYAVAIARAAGAEQFAAGPYAKATEGLAAAQAALASGRRSERKSAPGLARAAVIAGEDARRAAMLARTAAEAEASSNASAAAAGAEAKKAAERAAEVAAAAARVKAAEASRTDLLNRLNSVLPTHESDRGLVSEIGGVQFATGSAELSSAARVSLAKFSGIVASYPTLEFAVEGHTDSTGSDAINNKLSLRRAIGVRDYLIEQGVAASHIDAAGLGSSRPVADNATVAGRAHNRRVDIVISGGLPGRGAN
jgi:outer membrane protein OmpA-like peptidoglycan-associated protein